MSYDNPSHKRDQITKIRWRRDEIRDLRREAAMAGMQLATYIRELSQAARSMGAAQYIREQNGLDEQQRTTA